MKNLFAVLIICGAVSGYGQTFDGPAELPRVVMSTTITPSPNVPIVVMAGQSLQTALNSAVCGDTFLVDPAWTGFLTKLPTLACDAQHWIIITSSGTLPDENTRIKPSTSLPRIVLATASSRIIGGAFVVLRGFEITRVESTVAYTGAFVTPGTGAHDLIIDRSYIHGTATTESVRGIDLSNTVNVAVINSWISDFHCLAPGACGDAQAIAGGFSSTPDGNYLIQNNYLEAAGENILFGGSSATSVPADITIRGNDLHKPDSWNPDEPSYAPVNGKPWQVKNLFELKNARRVLFEGNRLTNTWGGFSQSGYAILLTPKNQGGTCAICAVEDVTIRSNWVSKTAEALQIAYASTSDGFWSAGGTRWSVHNNLFDQLQYSTCYGCSGWTVQISSGLSPTGTVLHDVVIDRNTFLLEGSKNSSGFLLIGGPPTGLPNIKYTNNVQYYGTYGIFATDWKSTNCTFNHQAKPDIISGCWTGASAFSGNIVLYQGTAFPATLKWFPAGNSLVQSGVDIPTLDNSLNVRK